MTITIFILFVTYTLACIADGPDVKPLWKKWLGKRLEVVSNALYPIQYVKRPMPDIDNPFVRQPIQVTSADTRLIQSTVEFNAYDFAMPDYIIAQAGEYEMTERQAEFAGSLKRGINNILMGIGRAAYQQGLANLELMYDRKSIFLHGEMRIIEPNRPLLRYPYVLFEGNRITMRYPDPFVDMKLVNKQQIQF